MTLLANTWRLEAELFSGTETFRNHMDIRYGLTGAPVDPTPAEAIVTAFINWITANYYPDVTLNVVRGRRISFYHTAPPHPDIPPMFELPLGTPGTANTTYGGAHNTLYLPQEVCIYARKTTSGGRNGKMFLRNILTEVDVQSTLAGSWAFSPGAGHFDPAVFNATSDSILGPYMVGGAGVADYRFAVTHLEHVPLTDTRDAFSTLMDNLHAVRPVWNRTSR